MAQIARTLLDQDAEAAVDAFGSIARVAILSFLRGHGPGTRGDIAEALGIDTQTVQLQLGHLRRLGVVVGEQIRASGTDRHRMLYSTDRARVATLLTALSAELADP